MDIRRSKTIFVSFPGSGPPRGGRMLFLLWRGPVPAAAAEAARPWCCRSSIRAWSTYPLIWRNTTASGTRIGKYTPDPAGIRSTAIPTEHRTCPALSPHWQASIIVPYVWNDNRYSGSRRTDGIGDTTLNLWYEALDDKSAWKIRI